MAGIEARVSAVTHLPASHAENLQILKCGFWQLVLRFSYEGWVGLAWGAMQHHQSSCASLTSLALPPFLHGPASLCLPLPASISACRYELGQEYKAHWDTIELPEGAQQQYSNQRALTLLMYLSGEPCSAALGGGGGGTAPCSPPMVAWIRAAQAAAQADHISLPPAAPPRYSHYPPPPAATDRCGGGRRDDIPGGALAGCRQAAAATLHRVWGQGGGNQAAEG